MEKFYAALASAVNAASHGKTATCAMWLYDARRALEPEIQLARSRLQLMYLHDLIRIWNTTVVHCRDLVAERLGPWPYLPFDAVPTCRRQYNTLNARWGPAAEIPESYLPSVPWWLIPHRERPLGVREADA